jgi:DNA polymerase I-like protein with 3'-5' exonuclease and polymerase domains
MDELILELDDDKEEEYKSLVEDALAAVNNQLKLNRELACDVKFGKKYSDIH